MSLSEMTAAPSPVTIAGKSYTASPIDFDGLGELEEYARARILSVAAKSAEALPPSQKDAVLECALKTATAIGFDSDEFNKYLSSGRGMITMLAISLRRAHPRMTAAAVAAMVKGRDAELVAAVETVLRISGFDDDGKAGPQPGEGEKGAAE